MNRRRRVLIMTLILLILTPSAVLSFTVMRGAGSPHFVFFLGPETDPPFMHWDLRRFPFCQVPYTFVGDADDPLPVNAADAAVDAAFAAWGNPPSPMSLVPVAGPPPPAARTFGLNGWNVVYFATDQADWPLPPDATSAVACLWSDAASGVMLESDIVLNALPNQVEWLIVGHDEQVPTGIVGGVPMAQRDVQTIMMHEVGHFLGLGHPTATHPAPDASHMSLDFYARVHPDGGPPGVSDHVLSADDVNGHVFLHTPDLGDAPDPFYPSLVHGTVADTPLNGLVRGLPNDGAGHLFGHFDAGWQYEWLGRETGGIDDSPAECEPLLVNLDDYDDGITIGAECLDDGTLAPDMRVTFHVRTGVDGQGNRHDYNNGNRLFMNAWFDWDGNGLWDELTEHVFSAGAIVEGDYVVPVVVPPDTPCDRWSRFRLDWKENVGQRLAIDPSLDLVRGAAQFGEVEDYQDVIPIPWDCYFHELAPLLVSLPFFPVDVHFGRICHAPEPWLVLLEDNPPPQLFPPGGMDCFDSTLTFEIDLDEDSAVDEGLAFTGPTCVRRSDPYLDETGLLNIDTEMLAFDLSGYSETLGPLSIRTVPGAANFGRIQQTAEALEAGVEVSRGFPALSFFDIAFYVRSSAGSSAAVGPTRVTARITSIPPGVAQHDVDQDSVANDVDGCPINPDPLQLDSDGDGVGDACDLCPHVANDAGTDADLDGIGDACDNCIAHDNQDQEDADNDAAGDVCDCAPTTGGIWASPSEARSLTLATTNQGATLLQWLAPTAAGGFAVRYDVIRSSDAGDFVAGDATCVESDGTDLLAMDTTALAPNQVLFYAVRAENDCGGTLGTDDDGVPQPGRECP